MRMRKRMLALAAIFALCLKPPLFASAQFVAWESEPEQDTSVEAGDTIRYAFTLEESAKAEDWTALRVQLGNGLLLQPESISITLAQQLSPVASAEMGEPQGTSGPEATDGLPQQTDDVQWEIIPGNDGFVILLSNIQAGDKVSFQATVQTQGDVSATARTGTLTSAISHTLVVPSAPSTAVVAATPAPAAVEPDRAPDTLRVLLAVVILVTLGLIGTVAYRRFGLSRVRTGQVAASMEQAIEQAEESALPEPDEKEHDIIDPDR